MTALAEAHRAGARHVFVIEGAASPQLPMRLMNFFAQQDLLPVAICLTRCADGIAMRIAEAGLDDHRAAIILAKMAALPEVGSAKLNDLPVARVDDGSGDWSKGGGR